MPYFYFDYTYLIVLPAILFALWAQSRVQSAHRECGKIYTRAGMTGADVARRVLLQNGVSGVSIQHVSGHLTDHFDPRENVIRLSDSVYGSSSAAAIGVAAHEAGHAVQYAKGYFPIRLRAAILPVTNVGSRLAIPLFLIGLLMTGLANATYATLGYSIALIGIAAFSLTALFQLITLPVEFNASRRAMVALETSYLWSDEELSAAKRMLTAAALTYVAALATSLLSLLRLMILLGGRRRR